MKGLAKPSKALYLQSKALQRWNEMQSIALAMQLLGKAKQDEMQSIALAMQLLGKAKQEGLAKPSKACCAAAQR